MSRPEFTYILKRAEWQVVIQQVDQYGRPNDLPDTLSSWATREEAVADLPNHGFEHHYVKGRWVPFGAAHGYENLEIQYREVPVAITPNMLQLIAD